MSQKNNQEQNNLEQRNRAESILKEISGNKIEPKDVDLEDKLLEIISSKTNDELKKYIEDSNNEIKQLEKEIENSKNKINQILKTEKELIAPANSLWGKVKKIANRVWDAISGKGRERSYQIRVLNAQTLNQLSEEVNKSFELHRYQFNFLENLYLRMHETQANIAELNLRMILLEGKNEYQSSYTRLKCLIDTLTINSQGFFKKLINSSARAYDKALRIAFETEITDALRSTYNKMIIPVMKEITLIANELYEHKNTVKPNFDSIVEECVKYRNDGINLLKEYYKKLKLNCDDFEELCEKTHNDMLEKLKYINELILKFNDEPVTCALNLLGFKAYLDKAKHKFVADGITLTIENFLKEKIYLYPFAFPS